MVSATSCNAQYSLKTTHLKTFGSHLVYVDNFYCEMFGHKFHLKFKNVIFNVKSHDYNPPLPPKKKNF